MGMAKPVVAVVNCDGKRLNSWFCKREKINLHSFVKTKARFYILEKNLSVYYVRDKRGKKTILKRKQ